MNQVGESGINFIFIASSQDTAWKSQAKCRRLQIVCDRFSTGISRVDKCRDIGGSRHHLSQQLKSLGRQFDVQVGDTGEVSPRPIEAGDKTELYWIIAP